MSRWIREKIVQELMERYRDQRNFLLIDYRGLKAQQTVELRQMLQEAGSKMNVVKNSVASHVFQNIGLTGLKDHLIGMNALVYGQDPIAFIKKVFSFKEKNKVLEIKCGWIEGTLVTDEDIRALSKIPSREHLLAQAVGAIASPLARLRFILEQFLVKFVSVIKGIQKKNEQRGD